MKKTLLLSVVASAVVMAGGDIAPVEPAVEAPVVEETASNWDFNGQAVIYYETNDRTSKYDLFDQGSSRADAGLQLKAVNDDVAYGIGAGVEVSALGTLALEKDVVSSVMANPSTGNLKGGWVSQAYVTYGMDNTSFKLGRQELPKALSPFAFSESWNVFKNTFDAALVVNTDIEDTTLVGAYVAGANNYGGMSTFGDLGASNKGVYMLTAQNKSVDDLTLTGTYYYAQEFAAGEDANILWVDAQYTMDNYLFAAQGGTVMCDALADDSIAFGAKVAGDFDMFKASLAFSSTDENFAMVNLGTGVKTPLYTQMIANQTTISQDADYVKVAASTELYDGNVGLAFGYAIANEDDTVGGKDNNPYELDLTYSTKVFDESTTLFAGYVMQNADIDPKNNASNLVRVWGRYNF